MPGMIHGEVASRSDFIWQLCPPTSGVDVDKLAYPLHQPTICSCQAWGQGLLSGTVLSCLCSRQWRHLVDVKLPGHRYLVESGSLRYLHY
jgi:hypothetical protein